jgi:PAS domain S-box-containing protein
VLLVDDDPTQLKLCRIRLEKEGFAVRTASNGEEALAMALDARPDAIVSDVLMGELDGFGFSRRVREHGELASVPILLLSAHYGSSHDRALAVRVGAWDLATRTPEFDREITLLKAALASTGPCPPDACDAGVYEEHLRRNANQLTKLLDRAKGADERYRMLFENASDTITVLDTDGVILETNERWRDVMGIPPEEMIGKHIRDYAAPGHAAANMELFERVVALGRGRADAVPIGLPDGGVLHMEFSVAVVEVDGRKLVFAIGHDVTRKVATAKALADAEHRHRSLIERIPDIIWNCTEDGTLTFLTRNVEHVFGYTTAELCAEDLETRIARVHPDDRARLRSALSGLFERGEPFDVEYRRLHKNGRWFWLRNRTTAVFECDGVRYFEGMATDVTERKQLEESVRLSQKMEAIGQLTGAIAHDFNNILAAILANSHFLIDDLARNDPRRADAEEIKESAERAAALTRQLLAFSRRQVLEPTIVDLNSTIGMLERMLRRLIGEDIEFSVVQSTAAALVRVDISQIEQVIMNLAVNARDAMPTGGKLVIETVNAELDGAGHPPLPAGKYVVVSVADTGCGMDADTKRRIFEPFFTTKAIGKAPASACPPRTAS